MLQERRINRSANLGEALTLQLAACAARAKLSSLVLIEDQGIPVASVGNSDEVEEIAVRAPQLATGNRCWHGSVRTLDGLKSATVCPVPTAMGRLFLCGAGGIGVSVDTELIRSGIGIRRIIN